MTLFELFNRIFADDRKDSPYVLCKHAHHWHRRGRKQLVECDPGTHEKFLLEFLQAVPAPGTTAENRRLLLIGPPGSGKSTYIRNQLAEFQRQSDIQSIIVDFRGLNDAHLDDETHDMRTGFYLRVSQKLSLCHLSAKINPSLKLLEMWQWVSNNPRILHDSEKLNQHLNTVIARVQCLLAGNRYLSETKNDSMRFLSTEQDDLERTLAARDRMWYEIMQILFKRQRTKGVRLLDPRDAVVLDNVDGLPKTLQLDAISIAGSIAETLECKVIVPLRPQTWRNINVEAGIHIVDHYCPDVSEVILTRIRSALTEPSIRLTQENRDALEHLRESLSNNTVFARMVLAAFSHNVRLALFSLSNLAENELLRTSKLEKLTIHQLSTAFFLGNSGELDRDRVEDLYSVGLVKEGARLIKSRILDYVIRSRDGLASRSEITLYMKRFGQAPANVDLAILELSKHLRPLLWLTQDGRDSSGEVLAVTEVGIRYMNDFFGELFYDRVTMVDARIKGSSAGRDRIFDIVNPTQVLARHNELTQEDFECLLHAVSSDADAAAFVRANCPFESMLCVTHWKRLKAGLLRVKTAYGGEIHFDPNRESYLRNMYDIIVREKRMPTEIAI